MLKEITLDTKFNSEQEIFEHVVFALAKQGEQSITECTANGACKYRHKNLRCAAGHLFPDELYYKAMESINWDSLANPKNNDYVKFHAYLKNSQLDRHTTFIRSIQWRLHDSIFEDFSSKKLFIMRADRFATDNNLNFIDWDSVNFSDKFGE